MQTSNELPSESKGSSTLGGLFWKFGERITAQLVSTIVSIVLLRILTPEDYGAVGIVTILITVCNSFVSGGLGNALIQKKDADSLDFSSIFYFGLLLSFGLFVALFGLAVPIARFYKNDQLIWIIRVMAIRLPVAAANSVQQAYISRKMQFRLFFVATLFGTVVSAFVGIIMARNGFGAWALVAQYLSNVTIDTIVLFFIGGWTPRIQFSLERVKKLLPYGMKLMGATLLDTLFNEIRSIIISARYSAVDLAMYDNGRKYPNLIVTNINSSISSVMFPVMSKLQDNIDSIKLTMKKSIKFSTFLLAPLLCGFFSCAPRFVDVVLTDKWLPCVPYLRMACIMCLFYPIHTINYQALNAVGESGKVLKLEVIKKSINIIILLSTMIFGVIWIAIGALVVSLLSTYINSIYSGKAFGYSFVEQIRDIIPYLALSTIMSVVIIAFDLYVDINSIFMLVMEVFIGAIIYYIGSRILKFDALNVLREKLHYIWLTIMKK